MPRYRLTIEYDGTGFVGWQRQANGLSIQEAIETAAAPLGCPVGGVRGAGRTTPGSTPRGRWPISISPSAIAPTACATPSTAALKPQRIAIRAAALADDTFDARHSAVRRRYLYRIVNRRPPLAIDAGLAWLVKPPLDAAAMHAAAQGLLGTHDFTTFRDSECQAASPIRTLEGFAVERHGERIEIKVWARSFLHAR